jgi:hypothetical protein
MLELTPNLILQVLGYCIVAVGLYYGIKLDLQATRNRAESAAKRADEAHELADEAHTKLYKHVTETPHLQRSNHYEYPDNK